MPELPEVETIVRGLKRKVRGKVIKDVWTEWPKHFPRNGGGFHVFKNLVCGAKIENFKRIGKNIIFELSNGVNILLHLKMTGRLLYLERGAKLGDKYTRTKFYFTDGSLLAFSDIRKFGKVLAAARNDFYKLADFRNVGEDALKISFRKFKEKILKRTTNIKKTLLDQKAIAGIGNIYADEILFVSGVHPLRKANALREVEAKQVFRATRTVLNKAVKLRGTSMSDYRDVDGKLGNYYDKRLVYGREGENCPRCQAKIKRIKFSGRSAHFCDNCQK